MTPDRRRQPRPPLRPERIEKLRLVNGRELWLRPMQRADAAPIAGAFELLGEEEVRRRYMHPVKALSDDYLEQLVAPPPGEGFAICAAEPLPPGEALVGAVARLTREPGSESAEFAILVSHFVSGQGLGQRLMLRLFEWARANGVRRIWGDVLDENTAMIALAQSLGFQRHASPDDPGLVRITLELGPKTTRRR